MSTQQTFSITLDARSFARLKALAELTESGINETAAELLRIVLARISKEAKNPNAVGV